LIYKKRLIYGLSVVHLPFICILNPGLHYGPPLQTGFLEACPDQQKAL